MVGCFLIIARAGSVRVVCAFSLLYTSSIHSSCTLPLLRLESTLLPLTPSLLPSPIVISGRATASAPFGVAPRLPSNGPRLLPACHWLVPAQVASWSRREKNHPAATRVETTQAPNLRPLRLRRSALNQNNKEQTFCRFVCMTIIRAVVRLFAVCCRAGDSKV
ncbi:hypothetical protein B0T19DRAFT_213146 [Cercophora scortea]|uniref:Secreted protein n=1 Tax=Cercophora scortea TaxID=314031 RepID=A0AAE0IF37_9PEZI|nr:hypothetical protein B0T19DRAFT_213146 [Cercophora scortea]